MKTEAASYDFLGRSGAPARGSATSHVTSALREAIVTLALRPGERLDKSEICERLQVSRFPVSEALARLQAEGLVEILPQRGSAVSLVRVADVIEHMLVRRALEAEVVRILATDRNPGALRALEHNLAEQRARAETEDAEAFHQSDLRFHELLRSGQQLAKISAIIEGARANLDRARRLINSPRRLALTIAEHELIVAAISRGDPEGAARAMRSHLDGVIAEVLAFAEQEKQLFADDASTLDPVLKAMFAAS